MCTLYSAGALAAAGLFLSVAVAAEPVESTHHEPEEVVVTASPLGGGELHLAQPVTVLSEEELRRKLAPTIGETLSHELGISSTAFGAGARRPVIRGLSGSRVRLLESGVSSMDVSNLSPDHAVGIEPLAATQIEVLKGPATLLYGSGAIGGVVNVVTNRIATELPPDFTAQAELNYGTVADERAGAFTADGALGRFAWHLDGSARDTHDYDIPGFGRLEPEAGETEGTLFSSDLETESITGGGSYIGEEGYVGFDVGHYASNYGVPGEGARIDLEQLRYDVKAEIRSPVPQFEKLKVQLGHVDYEHTEFEPGGDAGTTFLNGEYDGRFELLHVPLAGWHGALGMQIGHRDFEAIGEEALTPPLESHSESLFLVEERDLDAWHLELGGRIERQSVKPRDGSPKADHSAWSVSGGAVREFAGDYSAGLHVTRAQRAPGIEELYNNGPHAATQTFEVGSLALDAENANNADLTFRRLTGDWTWRMNLYANYIEDFIFARDVDADGDGAADRVDGEGNPSGGADSLLLVRYAQQDALFYGIEAETMLHLASAPWGDLDGRLSFDYVRGELSSGGNLPRITPMRFGAGLDYSRGRWLASLDVFRVMRQEDNAELESETGAYTLLDANVSYTLPTRQVNYMLSLRGTNLLDEEARVHTSFLKDVAPLPGRSLLLTLRAQY